MRRAAKVDGNQAEIVAALHAIGCTVQSLAAVGVGCPDLLVGYRGRNFLLEVKDGSRSPSEQQLTDAQKKFHRFWRGELHVVRTVEEALAVVTAEVAA